MLNNIVLLTEEALRLVERYFAFYGCAAHVAGGEAEGALGAGAVPAQECHVPFPLHADTAQELVLQVLSSLYYNVRQFYKKNSCKEKVNGISKMSHTMRNLSQHLYVITTY
jgi:hypothetical protein